MGNKVPSFKVDEESIDLLCGLMQRNQEADKDAKVLIKDMDMQAKEYESEGTI